MKLCLANKELQDAHLFGLIMSSPINGGSQGKVVQPSQSWVQKVVGRLLVSALCMHSKKAPECSIFRRSALEGHNMAPLISSAKGAGHISDFMCI